MSFVNLDVTTDPTQLLDDGIDSMNGTLTANGFPGWTANDATLVVIFLATVFQAFADVANTETTVGAAIWRAYGTQLLNIPYQNGTTADVLSTWTFTTAAPDDVSYFIPGATAVVIDNQFFYTQSDYTANEGDTTASILLVASQPGTAYNNIGGIGDTVALYQAMDFVASVVTQGVTANGQDPEDDATYQNRLVLAAQLQAPRPVVDSDFAAFVLSDIVGAETGVSVGRATSVDGYFPDGRALSTGGTNSPTVLTCTLVSTSATAHYTGTGILVPEIGATITGTGVPGGTTIAANPAPNDTTFTMSAAATASGAESLTVSAMSGYGPKHLTCIGSVTNTSTAATITTAPWLGAIPDVGARVTGTGIPVGATVIASPAPTTTTFSLSAAASASETNETITISSWTSVQLADCTFVTDINGNALSATDMDTLLAFVETYRPQNWLVNINGPSYNTIYVSTSIHVLPNADPTSVATNVQNAILTYLSPATWGNPNSGSNGSTNWFNSSQGFGVVRYLKLVGVAEAVVGVDYCASLTLGTSPSPGGTSDIVLVGPAPLPMSASGDIIVTTV